MVMRNKPPRSHQRLSADRDLLARADRGARAEAQLDALRRAVIRFAQARREAGTCSADIEALALAAAFAAGPELSAAALGRRAS